MDPWLVVTIASALGLVCLGDWWWSRRERQTNNDRDIELRHHWRELRWREYEQRMEREREEGS
jgi:hypothetical protein